jgi:glycosyltransferase involved in cell wall biosynthesis
LLNQETQEKPRWKEINAPLRICLLTYRGNPSSGGQGVYIKYLSKALRDLGHEVDVLSGPPYPELPAGVGLHQMPGLDLYNPEHLFKPKKVRELNSLWNIFELLSMSTGGFPEPLTFGVRAHRYISKTRDRYDIVHDNQGLFYGLLRIAKEGLPIVATVHHPITVDRRIEMKDADRLLKKIKVSRWYSFLGMQKRVIKKVPYIITVSEASQNDISREFNIARERFRVVPNGINTDNFHPVAGIKRSNNTIITTNSADTPLKGLKYLLSALSEIRRTRDVRLIVIGKPQKNGAIEKLISDLLLGDAVQFTGRIPNEAFPHYYAQATLAVIPSLYEGFGMPAGEAMACGVPLISTTGGALPEVVGDAGVLVPPGDVAALVQAITTLLDHPQLRRQLGEAGLARVDHSLTWRHAAEKTVAVYREAIHAYRRL